MQFPTALRWSAALAFALALPAHAQEQDAAPAADPGQVVATVNGTEITLGHMIALRSQLPQQYQQLPDEVLFDGVLEQLINQELLAQAQGEPGPGILLRVENERRALQANQVVNGVAEAAVTEEAVQEAYETAVAGAEPEQEFNASHILVETVEEAEALIGELEGGADFAALAQEHSTGPSGPNGGNLGWFGIGMMVKPFEDAILALSPGEISEPIQTQFGWHVVRLNESREKPAPSLEEMRGDLIETIQTLAIEAEIERLTDGAQIDRADLAEIDRSVISDLSLIED
jgi:peptidyl-prolyl cis-trans isomerase C